MKTKITYPETVTRIAGALFISSALAACGGGGDSGDVTADNGTTPVDQVAGDDALVIETPAPEGFTENASDDSVFAKGISRPSLITMSQFTELPTWSGGQSGIYSDVTGTSYEIPATTNQVRQRIGKIYFPTPLEAGSYVFDVRGSEKAIIFFHGSSQVIQAGNGSDRTTVFFELTRDVPGLTLQVQGSWGSRNDQEMSIGLNKMPCFTRCF